MSAVEFMQTTGVEFMHQLPRFGHGSDFSALFSTTQSEQIDYVMGLWAVSFFILAFFVMWGAILITLNCMGKQRVGMLAGRVQVVSDEKGDFYIPRHLCKLRLFYILLGLGILLCNAAIIGPGLRSVEDATFSVRRLTRDVEDLATQGLLIMDGVSNAERNIEKLDIESLLQLEDACPNLSGNTFLNDKRMKSSIATLNAAFDNLEDYVGGNEFENIRVSIDEIMDGTEYVDELVTEVEKNDWIVRMSVLCLNALVGFMIITTLVSLSGTYLEPLKFITMILVFPCFVVIISVSWIGAAVISMIGVSNADFCSGPQDNGPDGTVNSILQSFIHVESIIFKAFTYFQSDCTEPDPIQPFYKYEDYIQTGVVAAQTFLTNVEEVGMDEISSQCGVSVRPVIEGVSLLKDNLGILLSALRSTFDLASCSRMRPIYKSAFEGTACNDSAGSLILMFSLLLGVGVLGMLMIMLRAAMYPCKLVFSPEACLQPNEDDQEWQDYQDYLKYMTDFLSYWGHHEENSPSIHKEDDHNDDGTKSASSKEEEEIEDGIPETITCKASSSWEIPPSKNPDHESSCLNPNELEPLSPKSPTAPPATPAQCTHPISQQIDATNDECQPLSPDTPSIQSIKSGSRLRTPDFMTPGTFRRWRRNDVEDLPSSDSAEIPQTPLMISPKEFGGTSYFSKALNMTNFISPLAKKVNSPDGGRVENFAKNKYF